MHSHFLRTVVKKIHLSNIMSNALHLDQACIIRQKTFRIKSDPKQSSSIGAPQNVHCYLCVVPNIAIFLEDGGPERSYSPQPQVEDGTDANKLFRVSR